MNLYDEPVENEEQNTNDAEVDEDSKDKQLLDEAEEDSTDDGKNHHFN